MDDGVVKVAIMPSLGSDGPVEAFLVRISCRPGQQVAVAATLADRADVRYVALVTGDADILAEVILPRIGGSQARTLLELQSVPGVERLRSDLVLHVYKISHDWSRQLLGRSDGHVATVAPDACEVGHLDLQDRAIVQLLLEDGRASFKGIADRMGLNESTVRRRFDRLQQSGCLSVVTLVPAAALNMESEAMLNIRVAPDSISAVAEAMVEHREVRYTAATLDGNSLLCEVIASSTADLFGFVTNTLATQHGVLGWNANVELLTLKRGFVQTPWWRREVGIDGPEDAARAGAR